MFRLIFPAFGIMAPPAAKGAAFQEDCRPYARPIVNGEFLYVENNAFITGAELLLVAAWRQSTTLIIEFHPFHRYFPVPALQCRGRIAALIRTTGFQPPVPVRDA